MITYTKGVLIKCDPRTKQYILYLSESKALGKEFVEYDLDATHIFVEEEIKEKLEKRLEKMQDVLDGVVKKKKNVINKHEPWAAIHARFGIEN
ncbi:general transcription factor IIH subunit 5-like [Teleopsis dalmanni]|uniref:general transcription factor IIH subunit 5-like n=1 Tax=Teleopsis dalmanni TaxID=139649 RepID=UPI0018CF10A7|nr:general transcription factor IIH subunit 5-like [Teleopsis dalmanni]